MIRRCRLEDSRRGIVAVVTLVLALMVVVPSSFAAGFKPTETPDTTTETDITPSTTDGQSPVGQDTKAQKQPDYDLSFTLPTAGISGCGVCHSDEGISRRTATATGMASLYVSPDQFAPGPHAHLACTQCHIDFATKGSHEVATTSNAWRDIAKLSCKNCHKDQFSGLMNGAHTIAGSLTQADPAQVARDRAQQIGLDGKPKKGARITPLCGDCHKAHEILSYKDKAYKAGYRASSLKLCGSQDCHPDYAQSYNDPYHGAAAKLASTTAPTCYDCHGTHEILPADDLKSTVGEDNLMVTCEQCHIQAGSDYLLYASVIHDYDSALNENPVFAAIKKTIEPLFAGIKNWVKDVLP